MKLCWLQKGRMVHSDAVLLRLTGESVFKEMAISTYAKHHMTSLPEEQQPSAEQKGAAVDQPPEGEEQQQSVLCDKHTAPHFSQDHSLPPEVDRASQSPSARSNSDSPSSAWPSDEAAYN